MRLVDGHEATIDAWHLLGIDHESLSLVLRPLDLLAPVIASPEKLLRKFQS
jgi:hypothetical protein